MTERLLSNASPLATAVDDVSGLGVSRAYQFEMFEFSLKGNTIVVMDTGSGKTHVAILRIMHELENSQHSKFIWFLAPTVTLCIQQHEVLRRNIPSVSIRLIIGSDNVQRWTTQAVWDDLLGSHRIIVSTHAILSDALDHGFVNMQQIGLLIFDEAHHCSLDHPANRIMKNHYHPQLHRFGKEAAPAILGLTASPVMKAKVRSASLRYVI
jgi:ERCC4-related helicase